MKEVFSIKYKLLSIRKLFLLLIAYCLLSFGPFVRAAYTLPYPSYMPGHKLYSVSRMIDTVKRYWYFGSIAQVKYHLGLSDKYLMEAKTLFEYKQYLLGVDALKRSKKEFEALPFYVQQGEKEHKDMTSITTVIEEAGVIHRNILEGMKQTCPEIFQWVPEKAQSVQLELHKELDADRDTIESVIREISNGKTI